MTQGLHKLTSRPFKIKQCFVKPTSEFSKEHRHKYEPDITVIPVVHDLRVLAPQIHLKLDNISDRNTPRNLPALNTSRRGWAEKTMNNRPAYITHTQANSVPLHPIVCVCVSVWTGVWHVRVVFWSNNTTESHPWPNKQALISIAQNRKVDNDISDEHKCIKF